MSRPLLGKTREVAVYLPPGHDPQKSYPVLYAADGLEGVDCKLLEPLIASGKAPPFIIVGIGNSEQRFQEYVPGADPRIFAAHEKFFIEEVLPWAEKKFGASRDRRRRAVYGTSNSGPFALAMASKHPDLFGSVIAMMVYGLNFGDWEDELKEQPKDPTRFILVAGGEDQHGVEENEQVEQILKKKKFPASSAVIEGGGHTRELQQEQLPDCVEAIFADKKYQPRHRRMALLEAEAGAAQTVRKLGGQIQTQGKSVAAVDFRSKPLSDAQLKKAAKQLKELKNLQYLSLVGSRKVSDEGLKDLLRETKELKKLRVLFLGGTGITDAGLRELQPLQQLQQLGLGRTKVTDAGLKELKPLSELEVLFLANTQVTDEGLKELKDLKRLRQLILSGCPKVTKAGVNNLKKSMPKLQIAR